MHYLVAVVVPSDTTIDNAQAIITPLLDPYDENKEVEQYTEDGETYWRNPQGRWDWWQVGGRWTGVWSDYDPETDPANIETCFLCQGTGMRNDHAGTQQRQLDPGYTCNGCQGKGRSVKWPTDWKPGNGDIIPVSALLDNPELRRPFAVVIPDGGWHEKETYTWDAERRDVRVEKIPEAEWPGVVAKLLAPCRDAKLVVVDYHS